MMKILFPLCALLASSSILTAQNTGLGSALPPKTKENAPGNQSYRTPATSQKKTETVATPALPGNTLINAGNTGRLRVDLSKAILASEEKLSPGSAPILVDTKLVKVTKGDNADLTAAVWSEIWTVKRGAKSNATYTINFTGNGSKGIGYSVARNP